jgi:hypothetical protein
VHPKELLQTIDMANMLKAAFWKSAKSLLGSLPVNDKGRYHS